MPLSERFTHVVLNGAERFWRTWRAMPLRSVIDNGDKDHYGHKKKRPTLQLTGLIEKFYSRAFL